MRLPIPLDFAVRHPPVAAPLRRRQLPVGDLLTERVSSGLSTNERERAHPRPLDGRHPLARARRRPAHHRRRLRREAGDPFDFPSAADLMDTPARSSVRTASTGCPRTTSNIRSRRSGPPDARADFTLTPSAPLAGMYPEVRGEGFLPNTWTRLSMDGVGTSRSWRTTTSGSFVTGPPALTKAAGTHRC
jgi:hypothetical protein